MSSVYNGLAEFDGIEFFIKDIFHKMEIYNYYVKSKCILLRINTVYTISTLQFPNIFSSLESIPSVLKSIAKYSVGPGYKTKAVLMNVFYIATYNNKQKYIMFLSAGFFDLWFGPVPADCIMPGKCQFCLTQMHHEQGQIPEFKAKCNCDPK